MELSLDLKVIKAPKILWNLQRLYLPPCVNPKVIGNYTRVLAGNQAYLCRVYLDSLLQNQCCILDTTVECSPSGKVCDITFLQSIEVVPSVKLAKTIEVTVVFESPSKCLFWKENSDLCEVLNDILCNFAVVPDCVLKLQDVPIHPVSVSCIVVHSLGGLKAARVVEGTKIVIREVMSALRYEQMSEVSEDEIILCLERPLKDLSQTIRGRMSWKKTAAQVQVLLIGPGGSGKRSLVRRVCKDLGCVLVTADATDILRRESAEGPNKLWEQLKEAVLVSKELGKGLCILLVRHLDMLSYKKVKTQRELEAFLDSAASHPGVLVVGTCEAPYVLGEGLRSGARLNTEVYMDVPSEGERQRILEALLGGRVEKGVVREYAGKMPGFVLSDLLLFTRTTERLAKEGSQFVQAMSKSLALMEPSTLRGELGVVRNAQTDMNDLGGLSKVKKTLEQIISWPLKFPECFQRLGIPPPSGVLLYGPPGCAKTSLVRALATLTGTTFLSVSAADLYSPYVGDAERTIADLFRRARTAAPTILFVDEIDALVGSRDTKTTSHSESILSSFLTEIDGVGVRIDFEKKIHTASYSGVVVIGATNRPHMIDSALLRPGRFDRLIYVPPPSEEDRLEILQKLTKNMPLGPGVRLEAIASRTELYSGADLANLCREAALCALTQDGIDTSKVSGSHWENALEDCGPSLSGDQVNWFESFSFKKFDET